MRWTNCCSGMVVVLALTGCGGAGSAADTGQFVDAPDHDEAVAADVPAADSQDADAVTVTDPAGDPGQPDPGQADPGPSDQGAPDDAAGDVGPSELDAEFPGDTDVVPEDEGSSDPGLADEGPLDTGPVVCPAVEWVAIPGGTFQMGSAAVTTCSGGSSCAIPVHAVAVPGFQMNRTEVLVCQYALCVAAAACETGGNSSAPELNPRVAVSWDQWKLYCAWTGGRLCTEAEWEYAARNGSAGNTYPWGDAAPTCADAVYGTDTCGSPSAPSPACSKPAGNNAWGVCDLAGNVVEFVEDCYQGSYDGAPSDGSARQTCDTYGGNTKVTKGGGFRWNADNLMAAARGDDYPGVYSDIVGGRCCRAQ